MRAEIRERLKRIADLYPPERVEKSRRRIDNIWKDRDPSLPLPFHYGPCHLDYYDRIYRDDERIIVALDEMIYRGFADDDYIPGFFPGCHQGTIPEMFGAHEEVLGDVTASAPLIFSPEDIDKLPEPEIRPGGIADRLLALQRRFVEETEGAIPVNVMDMQGPAEVCAKLWSYEEFFVAACTEPELCLRFMNKIAAAFIMLWEAQRRQLGELFVPTHLWGWSYAPSGNGATLSQDGIVMVSPQFCEEIYNPSAELISDRFGGITVHSCGDFRHVLSALLKTRGLRGIHAGQLAITELREAGSVTLIANSPLERIEADLRFARREGLSCLLNVSGFWPGGEPAQWGAEQHKQCLERHRRIAAAAGR